MKYIYLIFTCSFFMISCHVLDEENISGVTEEYFLEPEGFQKGVNGCYTQLRSYYGSEWGANLTVFGTDEYTNAGEGGFHYMNQYTGGLNSEAAPFWNIWSDFYQAINTCNTLLEYAGNVEISEEERRSRTGEIHFLRAHYYFELVRLFGPIHLTLTPTVGVETEASRVPEEEVYDAIIEDLEYAVDHLPEEQSDWGRPTASAARHMLSLVYLTRAYRSFAGSDDFENAARLAIEVIESPHHRLLEDYAAIFDQENEINDEIIWAIQWTSNPLYNEGGINGNYAYYASWYEIYSAGLKRSIERGYGRPFVRFSPTAWGLENFRPLDVDLRFDKNFQVVWYYNDESGLPENAALGDTALWITDRHLTQADVDRIKNRLPGVQLFTWNIENQNDPWYRDINIWPSLQKYSDWIQTSISSLEGVRDHPVYRLGETYLNAAEALLMTGNKEEAAFYVNQIRRRAAYEGKEEEMKIEATDLDPEFLLDERARELFGERKRWFDLKRTGTLLERVRKYNPEAAPRIQEHHLLRPIPANQITRTSNDFPQNPGY